MAMNTNGTRYSAGVPDAANPTTDIATSPITASPSDCRRSPGAGGAVSLPGGQKNQSRP